MHANEDVVHRTSLCSSSNNQFVLVRLHAGGSVHCSYQTWTSLSEDGAPWFQQSFKPGILSRTEAELWRDRSRTFNWFSLILYLFKRCLLFFLPWRLAPWSLWWSFGQMLGPRLSSSMKDVLDLLVAPAPLGRWWHHWSTFFSGFPHAAWGVQGLRSFTNPTINA